MKPNKNNAVGIIGYGRFGKTLAQLLSNRFQIKFYDSSPPAALPSTVEYTDLKTVLSLPTVFIAVPIYEFADIIKKIAPNISSHTTVIDVCSVKIYPVKIMEEFLPPETGIIATHPLFGPDSIQENKELKIMMHPTRDLHHCFSYWEDFFTKKNIRVLKMTPDEHDQLAAKTQNLTHFIGRCLQTIDATPTAIDTNGYKKLLSVMEQTCNDSYELFTDLIRFNPYSKIMIEQFILAAQDLQQRVSQ